MTESNPIEAILKKIGDGHRLFYYGSTAYLHYFNSRLNVYRVLTTADLAVLAGELKGLQFHSGLNSNAYLINNEALYYFKVSEVSTEDRFEFLSRSLGGCYSLFYSPKEESFLFSGEYHRLTKSFRIDLDHYNFEDVLDTAYLFSSIDNPQYEFYGSFHGADLPVIEYLPLIEKILTSFNPYQGLYFLNQCGILDRIFPFLKRMQGVGQDRLLHPEGDVFEHTLNCFRYVKSPSLRLSLGLLLHDIGKVITRTRKGFSGHSSAGAFEVKKLLKQFGYDQSLIKEVAFLVENHMVNSYFFRIDDNTRNHIFNQEIGLDLMKLYKADTLGSIGKLDDYQRIVSSLKKIKQIKYFN